MSNRWMLDVLSDLQEFAHRNGMPRLADRLHETAALAREEIALQGDCAVRGADGSASRSGRSGKGGHA